MEASHPDVFCQEAPASVPRISAAPTATTGFVGTFATGPVGAPTPVRSFAEFSDLFGAAGNYTEASVAVHDFFENGGTSAVIVRATATDAPTVQELAASLSTLAATPTEVAPVQLLCIPDMARHARPFTHADFDRLLHSATTFCVDNRIFLLVDPNTPGDEGHQIESWLRLHPAWGSPNSAAYVPWLSTKSGTSAGVDRVAPSGSVAGVLARIDARRGVWKAPAGLEAKLEAKVLTTVSENQQSLLNRHGVNVIREFAPAGTVIWGARTGAGSIANEYRYVPVRRLALCIENSLHAGLDWVVFEPNDEPLWARVRLSVATFLETLWRAGAFVGATPQQAFYVRCDPSTMTRVDQRRGRTILQLGFAPLKPAEFVTISIALTRQ